MRRHKVNAGPQRSCLNRGAVAHHPLARAASAAPSRAREEFGASGLTRGLAQERRQLERLQVMRGRKLGRVGHDAAPVSSEDVALVMR